MNFLFRPIRAVIVLGVPALLAACVQISAGPTVAAMPAPNKSFELFVQDDQLCRNWAASSSRGGHEPGDHRGAGTGAAIGTLAGAGFGSEPSAANAWSAQRRYDIAYLQCMYAKGNVIPGYTRI